MQGDEQKAKDMRLYVNRCVYQARTGKGSVASTDKSLREKLMGKVRIHIRVYMRISVHSSVIYLCVLCVLM